MTRNEFIDWLKSELKPNAQMDFLVVDYENILEQQVTAVAFLDIHSIGMNVDVDDPGNRKRGGIVFEIKDNLTADLNERKTNNIVQKIVDTIDQELEESPSYDEYHCKDGSVISTDVGYVEDWWRKYRRKLLEAK